MPTVQKATVPLKGKMKKVIRDEAKLNKLIAGYLIVDAVERVDPSKGDENFFGEDTVPVCKGPGHCAMGALMFAAGISNQRIQRFEDGGYDLGTYEHGPIARKLFDTYRIDGKDAGEIITGNDSISTGSSMCDTVAAHKKGVQSRLKKVLATIDKLPKRERVRPPLTEPLWEA